jgi:hypothetical protein
MRAPRSRCLTIDASIVLAAGEKEEGSSSSCRRVLQEILSVCHKVVITDAIRDEWVKRPVERGKRPSKFGLIWRGSMTARKKIVRLTPLPDSGLREKIDKLTLSDEDRTEIEADLHLIEAALATDRIVLSLDREIVRLLRGICSEIGELRQVNWVDPVADCDDTLAWLRAGAKRERKRELRGGDD